MTWIRIDPNEMETASRELQSCSTTVGDTVAGLQAQSGALPATVSAQVATTLATLERQLHDIRVEILLEATILALRGILALKGSPVAGTMSMEVPAPTTGFVGGNQITGGVTGFVGGGLITSGITSGSSGTTTIGGAFAGAVPATGLNPGGLGIIGGNAGPGFTITNADGTPAGPGFYSTSAIISAPTSLSPLGLDPRIGGALPESSFTKPEGNDFPTWAGSRTRDSDGDGVVNGMDANPGSYDPAYVDKDPSTKPPNF